MPFDGDHALEGREYQEKTKTLRDQYGPADETTTITSTNQAQTCGTTPPTWPRSRMARSAAYRAAPRSTAPPGASVDAPTGLNGPG